MGTYMILSNTYYKSQVTEKFLEANNKINEKD